MNDDIKQRIDHIKQLENQSKDIEAKIKAEEAELVEKHHPLQLGQITDDSYQGKQIQITGRFFRGCWREPLWTAEGNVINKNGKPGKNIGYWKQKVKINE